MPLISTRLLLGAHLPLAPVAPSGARIDSCVTASSGDGIAVENGLVTISSVKPQRGSGERHRVFRAENQQDLVGTALGSCTFDLGGLEAV